MHNRYLNKYHIMKSPLKSLQTIEKSSIPMEIQLLRDKH